MALALNFDSEISDDGTTLTITELTGAYSATTNAGGWGSPNPTIASSLTATITISQLTDGDNNIYTTPIVVIAYPTLPNITNTIFNFTASQAGYGPNSIFPDAVYNITYTVTGNSGGAYTASQSFYFTYTPTINKKMKQFTNNVSISFCSNQLLLEQYQEFSTQYDLLCAAIGCGNTQQIFEYIQYLSNELSDPDCGCN
jgi:hypothetical protein